VEEKIRHGGVRCRLSSSVRCATPDSESAGGLEGLPGDPKNRIQNTGGTIEPVDQIDRDVYTVSKGVAAGGLAGALSGGGLGAGIGAAVGGALGLAKAVFNGEDEIGLEVGTKVEMASQRPVVIGIR